MRLKPRDYETRTRDRPLYCPGSPLKKVWFHWTSCAVKSNVGNLDSPKMFKQNPGVSPRKMHAVIQSYQDISLELNLWLGSSYIVSNYLRSYYSNHYCLQCLSIMSDASFIGSIHRRNYIFLLYGGSFTYVTHNSSIEEDFNEM